jgi:hypothetical protein
MDLEEQFLQVAANVSATCRSRGKQTRSWSGSSQTVVGWRVDHVDRPITTRGNPGARGGWFEEAWGHTDVILDQAGHFWVYDFQGYEGTDYANGAQISHSLGRTGTQRFVGQKGKPYAEWTSKLERLPYT